MYNSIVNANSFAEKPLLYIHTGGGGGSSKSTKQGIPNVLCWGRLCSFRGTHTQPLRAKGTPLVLRHLLLKKRTDGKMRNFFFAQVVIIAR